MYLTTNTVNGNKYIGQHASSEFDSHYKGSGVNITKAIKKYGKSVFTVKLLEWCENKDSLNSREEFYISHYNAVERQDFYNASTAAGCTGYIGDKSPTKRPEVRAKMSKNHADVSGKNNPNYGKKMSEEQKRKISETKRKNKDSVGKKNPMFGKHHTEAAKKKMSEAAKLRPVNYGKDNHNYGRKWMNNGILNRAVTSDKISYFLQQGWNFGRLTPQSSTTIPKGSRTQESSKS